MSLEARIRELAERHKRLDAAIAAELKHPAGDEVRIHELKRKKLRIKDEITQLQTGPA
ncbi:MAG: YdcH family protein [Hyphomonadaceae bacterium]|nr:YdcH family protein [Hyphomonadaceae bacterium]